MNEITEYNSLTDIAKFFQEKLQEKRYILLYGYNGTGKTRLSYEFKSLNQKKNKDNETVSSDTLYYNAFTEDLFFWDNDIYDDTYRVLRFNKKSKFFSPFKTLNIDTIAREILYNFADFDFTMYYNDTDNNIEDYGYIEFYRVINNEQINNIKISRGEESIFILCLFLAVVKVVLEQSNEQNKSYEWVKYIYIDDPVSSLDDNNIISLAVFIANLFKPIKSDNNEIINATDKIPVIVSTHHTLFYNVMYNEWNKALKGNSYFLLSKNNNDKISYILKDTNDTPFFYHVAMINKLVKASESGQLYTYHFAILRNILEKTASFFGYTHFQECLKINKEKQSDNMLNDEIYYNRAIQVLNHGGYSLFEPVEMGVETKEIFSATLTLFLNNFKFNIEKDIIEKENNDGK